MNAPSIDLASLDPATPLLQRLRALQAAAADHSPIARAMADGVSTYVHEGIYRQTSAGNGGPAFKRARRRLESFMRRQTETDVLWPYLNDNRTLAYAMQSLLEYL